MQTIHQNLKTNFLYGAIFYIGTIVGKFERDKPSEKLMRTLGYWFWGLMLIDFLIAILHHYAI